MYDFTFKFKKKYWGYSFTALNLSKLNISEKIVDLLRNGVEWSQFSNFVLAEFHFIH
jgi:hypothetical protein